MKVCESFLGERYELPRTKDEIYDRLAKSKNALDNLYNTIEFTIENFKKYLVSIQHSTYANGHSILQIYKMYLKKARSVQITLNKLKSDRSLLIGLFWVPNKFAGLVKEQIYKRGKTRAA